MSPTAPLTARTSNVYYLAPATAPPPARTPRLSTSLVIRLRLLSAWWRLRLTAVEMWDVLRRFGRRDVPTDGTFLEQQAEIILAAPPRPIGPARVIDFETARVRLRG